MALPHRTALTAAVAGLLTGALAVVVEAGVVTVGAAALAWLVTAVLGDRRMSPVGAALDRDTAVRSLPWVIALLGLPATGIAAVHDAGLVRVGDPWWALPVVVAALGCAVTTRIRVPERLRPVLPWCAYAFAGLAVLIALVEPDPARSGPADGDWPLVVALATLALVAPMTRARHAVVVWTAWLVLAPVVGTAAWAASADLRGLGNAVTAGAAILVGGLLAVGALLVDRARPGDPRPVPRRPAALPPFAVGAGTLVVGGVVAVMLPHLPPPATGSQATLVLPTSAVVASGVLLLALAGFAAVVAGLGGVGTVGATAALLAWAGARVLYTGGPAPLVEPAVAYVDVAVAGLLLLIALLASLAPVRHRWARWDVPLAVVAAAPALAALAVAVPANRSPVYLLVGGLAIGTAVRLARLRAISETLAAIGSVLVVVAAAWASTDWAAAALAGLAAAHTALAALYESGTWRTARQWVGALLAAVAWMVAVGGPTLGADLQGQADLSAVGGATVAVGVLAAAAARRLDRSWCAPWGAVGATVAVLGGLGPALSVAFVPQLTSDPVVVVGWWQTLAWVVLAVAALLAAQVHPVWRTGWRVTGAVLVLTGLLAGLAAASAGIGTRVTVLALVSLFPTIVVAVQGRAIRRAILVPLVVLGVGALVLAVGFALIGDGPDVPRPVLVAAVLAVAAVQAAAYGVALRRLPLRLAAPVLAWTAWAVYAADAVGGVVAWYTIPVGVALIAVVEVWRADRRARKLPAGEPGIAALDLAGIGFLVIASFVAAFTLGVVHALVAAGIGVLVFWWAALTRVRRRLVASAVIVLAGVVVAVVLPLVDIVPAWGSAAVWVAVAVVGLLVVLAATLLERGRAAVRSGRARIREATAGWE